jgi:hypothetical protein
VSNGNGQPILFRYYGNVLSMSQATAQSDGWLSQVDWNRFNNTAVGAVPVPSVFGRTGDITAEAGDYAAFYPSLTGSYADPPWITSLDYGKISNAPIPVVYRDSIQSLAGTGPDLNSNVVTLIGDVPTPAASLYYGTNASGTRGYFALPLGSLTGVAPPITNTSGVVGLDQTANYAWTGLHQWTNPSPTGPPPIKILVAAGQSADLIQIRNPADTSSYFSVSNANIYHSGSMLCNLYRNNLANSPYIYLVVNTEMGIRAANNQICATLAKTVGNQPNTFFTGANPANIALAVQGAASQTADLQQWQSSTGAVLASISADGSRFVLNPAANTWSIGQASTVSTAGSLAVGTSASASGQGTAMGYASNAAGGVAFGMSASAGANAGAFGGGAHAGTNAFALAPNADASAGACIAMGYSAVAPAACFVAGSQYVPMNDVYFGQGVTNATPTAWALHGTGGNGTDIAGADLVLAGGRGTGAGLGGAVRIQLAPAGTTGSALNALVNKVTINAGGLTLVSGVFTGNGSGLTNLPSAGGEPPLGNPSVNGYFLVSTIAGVRSWTNAVIGTATNDNAAGGTVGETLTSSLATTAAVGMTNNTARNIIVMSIFAGDWDVRGSITYISSVAAGGYALGGGNIGTTNQVIPDDGKQAYAVMANPTAAAQTQNCTATLAPRRISVATTTNLYLVGLAQFAGTVTAYGFIEARRVR